METTTNNIKLPDITEDAVDIPGLDTIKKSFSLVFFNLNKSTRKIGLADPKQLAATSPSDALKNSNYYPDNISNMTGKSHNEVDTIFYYCQRQ